MTANQANAEAFNPNQLDFTRVATYQRSIQAPIDRVWENVLDWEHLPWLHKSSFDYVELDQGGDWGWRTWSNVEHTAHVELTVATSDSYVARSYVVDDQVSEIWTTLTANGERTDVEVTFDFPGVDPGQKDRLGQSIVALYTQLWDEDEAMMRERHLRLLEERATESEVSVGSVDAIEQAINAEKEIIFQLNRREFRVRKTEAGLVAHPTICPHLLGPLENYDEQNNLLSCPWHGYQFDLSTGECVSPKHATCHLPAAPDLTPRDGNLIASRR